jgi:hypothetical protein
MDETGRRQELNFRSIAESLHEVQGNLFAGIRYLRDEKGIIRKVMAAQGTDFTPEFLSAFVDVMHTIPVDLMNPQRSERQEVLEFGDGCILRELGAGEEGKAFLVEIASPDGVNKVFVAKVTRIYTGMGVNIPDDPCISPTFTKEILAFSIQPVQFAKYSDARVFAQIPLEKEDTLQTTVVIQEYVCGFPLDRRANTLTPLDFYSKEIVSLKDQLFYIAGRIIHSVMSHAIVQLAYQKVRRYITDHGYFLTLDSRDSGASELLGKNTILEEIPAQLGQGVPLWILGENGYGIQWVRYNPVVVDVTIHDTDLRSKHK